MQYSCNIHHKSKIETKEKFKPSLIENTQQELNARSNKIRTNLLLIANDELNKLKKNCYTKINDKTLKMAEKEFTLQNNQMINLKSEFFHPFTNQGQAFFQKQTNKYVYNSPDDLTRPPKTKLDYSSAEKERREFSSNTKVSDMDISFSQSPQKLVEKKQSIFKKKDEYFKNVTLKIFREEDFESNEVETLKEERKKVKTIGVRKTSLENNDILTSTISRNEDKCKNDVKRFIIHKFLVNLLLRDVNPVKKKKKKLAAEGLKYLNNLSKKIKMKYKRKAFCSSAEREAGKDKEKQKEREEISIKKANSFNEINEPVQRQTFKSYSNIYDKKSQNLFNDKKTSSNNLNYQLLVTAPNGSSPIKNKSREKKRGNNHNRLIPKAGAKTKSELSPYAMSDGKETNNRPRKQMLSSLSKSNGKDNLSNSFNLPESTNKGEFFIKLYKC